MNLDNAITKIKNFNVNDDMEDYQISEFFDVIRDELTNVGSFTDLQKEQLILKFNH